MSLTLIKIGGALVDDADALDALWTGVAALRDEGPVVVVHGGGPQATAMARRLGHEPRIVHGRRVTTDLDLDIVRWTIRGALNSGLVAAALGHGLPAVGLAAADGATVRVVRRPAWEVEGEAVDFGHVGDVEAVDPRLLHVLLGGGFVPVVAPLAADAAGALYNVNADTVACALAGALEAQTFLLVTEAGGVRRDPGDPTTRLTTCDAALFQEGLDAGWIGGGMRVKLSVAFEARAAGAADVHILAPGDLVARAMGTRVV